jgi:hypothetical protein
LIDAVSKIASVQNHDELSVIAAVKNQGFMKDTESVENYKIE